MPEWLVARSAMKELNDYVHSLYDLAHSAKPYGGPDFRGNLMDTLASLQLDFKV